MFILSITACTSAGYESTNSVANPLLKSSVIDAVNLALNQQDCTRALISVLPLYNSVNTDNSIRLATAASYGCAAKIQVLTLLTDIVSFVGGLGGPGFWEFLVQEFPSISSPIDDKIPQAAENGIDAIFATLNPGTILVPSTTVNSSSQNPGSLEIFDRTQDANTYITFLGMSLMGSLLNRNGNPTSNHHKSNPLPWSSATLMAGDGCAFVSGLLNFYDGLQFIQSISPAYVSTVYGAIETFLSAFLSTGCSAGCAACGLTCTTCPTALRDRNSCTGLSTDPNSCAAAGLVVFVNGSWSGPP